MSISAQNVFDRVANHLLKQGVQAKDSDGVHCRYRGENGCKCAIGCLIQDRTYEPEFEGNTVSDLLDQHGPKLPQYFETHRNLLIKLQQIHDWNDPGRWRELLVRTAENAGLNLKALRPFRCA